MIYVKITALNSEFTKLLLDELQKYQGKYSCKILTETFLVKNNFVIISSNFITRKTFNTIRWIDDILYLKFKDKILNFNFIISNDVNEIKKCTLNEDKKLLLLPTKEMRQELKSWTYVNVFENNKNYIRFDFDFYSKLYYSKKVNLKTRFGVGKIQTVEVHSHNKLFTIFTIGKIKSVMNLRIHYQCETAEIFDSLHCDCREQLSKYKKIIFEQGGILIYAHEEGRGLGLTNKINAYYNTNKYGYDTVDALVKETGIYENRMFEIPADIVFQMNVKKVNMWTNNPNKIKPFLDRGIKVNRLNAWCKVNSTEAKKYVATKKQKMDHYDTNIS